MSYTTCNSNLCDLTKVMYIISFSTVIYPYIGTGNISYQMLSLPRNELQLGFLVTQNSALFLSGILIALETDIELFAWYFNDMRFLFYSECVPHISHGEPISLLPLEWL
jgi:hypothetical protein